MRPPVQDGDLHVASRPANCAVVEAGANYAVGGAELGASLCCRRCNGTFDRMARKDPRGRPRGGLGPQLCRTPSRRRPGFVLLCVEAPVAGPSELQLRAMGRRRWSMAA